MVRGPIRPAGDGTPVLTALIARALVSVPGVLNDRQARPNAL